MIRSLLKAAICVPLFALLASAQAETPEAVVEQLMAATKANDRGRVVAISFRGSSGNQIEVTSLIRTGPTWRALLKGDRTQMATRLRAALLQGPGP